MFINKTKDGKNNLCGEKVADLRKLFAAHKLRRPPEPPAGGVFADKSDRRQTQSGRTSCDAGTGRASFYIKRGDLARNSCFFAKTVV